jgi:hypothetical protein
MMPMLASWLDLLTGHRADRERRQARRLDDVRATAWRLATQQAEPTEADLHAFARLHEGRLFSVR